jgi:glyoxylase-like metal-dependent hydrolase (beta-lactamase superfamily II)/rhodanese-related sulfurtransferase
MFFKQFYLGCLAHASYLIGSHGEAVVVDPQRDVDQYITEAGTQGLQIKYVVETHLHADFVSGHRELASRTGAQIVFGEKAGATFAHKPVRDGDELKVGDITLRVLETPGHTPEGISIVVIDPTVSTQPQMVLTGDTLFIGDVGRPDLAGARGHTAEEMAGMLYDSLHGKLLTLPDEVGVFPAHGAGSMCGRNISKETSSTIGEQRRYNYALKSMAREEFVRMMTTDLPEAPAYFSSDAEINRTGAAPLDQLPRPAGLLPVEVKNAKEKGDLILDVRSSGAFGAGHVPGSLNIALSGQFASWAGSLIPLGTSIVIVAEDETGVDEAVTRLARVGIDSVRGYLNGGIYAWNQAGFETATITQMPVDELHHQIIEGADLQIVDVRRPGEFQSGHAAGARNLTLAHLVEHVAELDAERPTAVICQSGYRSSAGASLLQRLGFSQVFNVVGGTSAWIGAGYPVE